MAIVETELDTKLLQNGIRVANALYSNSHADKTPQAISSAVDEKEVVRKLGCVECYQAALQDLDQIRAIILACRYQLPSSLVSDTTGTKLRDTFERAVACVVLKHPHMAVALSDRHTTQPSWIRLTSLNLDHHIGWRTINGDVEALRNEFQLVMNSELNAKLDGRPDSPGWMIKVLHQDGQNSIEVLLVFSHTSIDAHGARLIHQDILQTLYELPHVSQDIDLSNHILTVPKDLALKLVPPPEVIIEFPVDENLKLAFLQDNVETPADRYPRSPMQAHWAPIAPSPLETQYRTLTIPNTRVRELVRACHQHEVTITSLFHVLSLCSLTPLLDTSSASAFYSMTAMDIRRFLPSQETSHPWFHPAKAVSNFVTILGHTFDEELVALLRSQLSSVTTPSNSLMDFIWSTAKVVRQDIATKLSQGVDNDMIGFAQAITDWRTQLMEQTRRPRSASWVITNLGVVDGEPDRSTSASIPVTAGISDWSISHAEFIMSANVVSAAFSIAMVTISGGALSINCTWQDCVMDRDMGEAFVTNLAMWLELMASEAPLSMNEFRVETQ